MNRPLPVLPATHRRSPPSGTAGRAAFFRALGDETRMEIVALLAASPGALCACEIEARFDLSQPTISHHLRLLREAGVVTSERRGSWVHYALDPGAATILDEFRALLAR